VFCSLCPVRVVLYFAIVDPISRSALGGLQRRPISKAWTSAPGGSSCPQYTAGGLVPNGVDAESGNGGEARRGAASTASPCGLSCGRPLSPLPLGLGEDADAS
jgi:hypothetical protein